MATATDAAPDRALRRPGVPRPEGDRPDAAEARVALLEQYRQEPMGMVGLVILIFFILMAMFAPLLARQGGL